jgi:hypothetical protein
VTIVTNPPHTVSSTPIPRGRGGKIAVYPLLSATGQPGANVDLVFKIAVHPYLVAQSRKRGGIVNFYFCNGTKLKPGILLVSFGIVTLLAICDDW